MVERPGRLPDLHGPPGAGAGRGGRARPDRRAARRRRRTLLVARARRSRRSRESGLRVPRQARRAPPSSAGPPRAPPSRRSRSTRGDAPVLPAMARGTARPSRPPGGHCMRLLVCGGAGFIGSNFVRERARRARRRDHGARQAHLRRPAREPRRARRRGWSSAASRTPTRSPRRSRVPTRSSTSRPRRTSTARSAEPDAFVTTHALGTYTLLEAARERGAPLRAGARPTRSTARSRRARSPSSRRSSRPRPTRPPRPAPTCWSRPTTTRTASRR